MSSIRKWSRPFPYKVDYNDHFETPDIAYRDILPLLDFVSGKNRESHCIYDPYFCNGRTKELLQDLGFPNVVHECRDFYHDMINDSIPQHDTLVTNPPYSDQHKEKCLTFVLEQLRTKGRPFFVLMPNYVAAREYYRTLVEKENSEEDVVYLLPSEPYEYDHPEGTGKAESPFASMWYCGIGKDKVADSQNCNLGKARLVTNLKELREHKAIPTKKRPNPKQRRKRKAYEPSSGEVKGITCKTTEHPTKANRKSKHRDEFGQRKKRRF